ncbi:ABC transporter permease [Bacillus xiapuensis]|uniref:ABC transporter permease n=1 Tax=Bacillus xiapuensis TaxID=2014075 RepID=UPI000C240540|nr:ABC transporter permease [Bacillus xiapuensis]
MFRLIKNEWIKIFKRPGTYVMIGLLVLMVAGIAGLTKYSDSKQQEQANWEQVVKAEIAGYQKQLKEDSYMTKDQKEYIKGQIKVNEYRLQNDVPADVKTTMWTFIEDNAQLLNFVGLFMIIIAAGSVASEYTWGTIKLLLIRPISRPKILLSKYLGVVLFGLFMMAVLFLLSSLIGAILFGTSGQSVHLAYEGGKVVEQSLVLHLAKLYLLQSISVFMMATMAFMISAAFRSSSLAIGIAMFLLFMGPSVTGLIAMKYDWAKYSLFANTDLLQFETGRVLVDGMTLGFSLTVLAVYFIIFHVLAFTIFSKRDVAA